MESPLLRAGVAAAQLALGQSPKSFKKEESEDPGSEGKKRVKTEQEVKKEGTPETCLPIEVFILSCKVYLDLKNKFVLSMLS